MRDLEQFLHRNVLGDPRTRYQRRQMDAQRRMRGGKTLSSPAPKPASKPQTRQGLKAADPTSQRRLPQLRQQQQGKATDPNSQTQTRLQQQQSKAADPSLIVQQQQGLKAAFDPAKLLQVENRRRIQQTQRQDQRLQKLGKLYAKVFKYILLFVFFTLPFLVYYVSLKNKQEFNDPDFKPNDDFMRKLDKHNKRDITSIIFGIVYKIVSIIGYFVLFFFLNILVNRRYPVPVFTWFRVISFVLILCDVVWLAYRIYYDINIKIPEIKSFYQKLKSQNH
jgi:hypothetical protein